MGCVLSLFKKCKSYLCLDRRNGIDIDKLAAEFGRNQNDDRASKIRQIMCNLEASEMNFLRNKNK